MYVMMKPMRTSMYKYISIIDYNQKEGNKRY